MKNILSITFLLITLNIQAHGFHTAKLLLVNGETIEGTATLPQNRHQNNSIKVKKNGIKIASSIHSNDIYQILYTFQNGNNYLFERNNLGLTPKPFKKHRSGSVSGKEWFLVTLSHPLIKAYISTQSYYLDKEKGIIATHSYEGRNINFGTSYLLKRPNEEAPTVISMYNLSNSKFRKWASDYFIENTELVLRIKNKEFKGFEVDQLALAYISYK